MKLGKLLFAGKSIVSGSERVSYRQNKLVALPKFESSKNPFTLTKTPPEAGPVPDKKESGQAPNADRKREPAPKATKSLASWTTRLNPASFWGGAAPAVRKAPPGVQTELSLDAVKVVHNDLSDADVEVVPIKSRPAASLVRAKSPARSSWEILGERLLKATTL